MDKPSLSQMQKAFNGFDESDMVVVNAWYEEHNRQICITLKNGVLVGIPVQNEPSLHRLSEHELKQIQWDHESIFWEKQDIYLDAYGTIFAALNNPIFELHYRTYLARQMGQSKTFAKAQAARENGKKGGRPIKQERKDVSA